MRYGNRNEQVKPEGNSTSTIAALICSHMINAEMKSTTHLESAKSARWSAVIKCDGVRRRAARKKQGATIKLPVARLNERNANTPLIKR